MSRFQGWFYHLIKKLIGAKVLLLSTFIIAMYAFADTNLSPNSLTSPTDLENQKNIITSLQAANVDKSAPNLQQVAAMTQTTPSPSLARTPASSPPVDQSSTLPVDNSSNSQSFKPMSFQSSGQSHLWNLQNADIHSVIDEISRETGKNFVVDPRVQGKISIVSSTPLNPDEVYQVFLSSLQVLGFAAIPAGPIIKIVPNADAKSLGALVASQNNPGHGDEIVVRAIPLQNVSAMQLAPILRPLIPEWGVLSYYAPSNVIIAAGPADSVRRLADIINRVDSTNANGIDMISLHYASALDVVNTIQSLEDAAKQQGNTPEVSVAAEPASNSVLLSGNKHARLKMRVLISELDTPSANGVSGNTQVINLRYLKAQDLVPVLAGVAKSYYRGPVGTVIGVRSKIGIDYTSLTNTNIGGNGSSSNETAAEPPQAPIIPSQPAATQQVQTTTSEVTNPADEEKPKIELIAEPNTNSIIINAPPTLMSILRSVVTRLDVRPAQVLIEALIAEVDENTVAQLGIQWGSLTLPNTIGTAAIDAIPGFREGVGIINGKGIHNLQGVIQALGRDQGANILSTPAVLVLDNQQAQILVGQEVSIQESTYPGNGNGTTGASPYSTFGREKVALHLYVTPQITQGKSIQLSIDQGNDSLQNPNDTSTTPVINISSIKTAILANSGDIIVLGGLIQNQVASSNSHIPILGDIPLLGHLFRVDTNSSVKKDLMVFLRPIIVSNPCCSRAITDDKYQYMRDEQLGWLQTQPYFEKQEENILPDPHPVRLPVPFHHREY
jgi:general secretion pathway protein D